MRFAHLCVGSVLCTFCADVGFGDEKVGGKFSELDDGRMPALVAETAAYRYPRRSGFPLACRRGSEWEDERGVQVNSNAEQETWIFSPFPQLLLSMV
jgi:hypothetical protein